MFKDIRESIDKELPEMLVIPVEDEDSYIEKAGLEAASRLTSIASGEGHSIEELDCVISDLLDYIADKDIQVLKDIVAQKRANQIKLTELADKYDEAGISKSAASSLKKLLKKGK